MYTATQLLIATLMTIPAADGVRDLCEVVHRETGTPTICKPHKEGAPVYGANVCCAGASCFAESVDGCQDGEVLYYCELGALAPTGEVNCYFEVPDYCAAHTCDFSVASSPQEIPICCNQGVCWEHNINANDCELDDIYWCSSGVSNQDGTITCLDDQDS